jgi:multidrug resistance efflux pump
MFRSTFIMLASAGLAGAVWTVVTSQPLPAEITPDRPAAANPYRHGISASGIVEAATRNVRVASPESGVIAAVFVQVNDTVKAGDALFQLDTRLVQAELARAQAAVTVQRRLLQRLESPPRHEDVAPLRATVQRATVQQAEADDELQRAHRLHDRNAMSSADLARHRFAADKANADLLKGQAELDRTLAGTWEQELKIARGSLELAETELQLVQARLDRLTIRSPTDGAVLKRYVEPGEFTVGNGPPAMVIGDLTRLHVRAQVDERDTPMLRPGARATATITGSDCQQFQLTMIRVEPLSVPKTQLTGMDTELVDTRVVEVIFEVEPGARLYPGQVVDTFIEVGEIQNHGGQNHGDPSGGLVRPEASGK